MIRKIGRQSSHFVTLMSLLDIPSCRSVLMVTRCGDETETETGTTQSDEFNQFTSGERLIIGKGVLVIQSYFKALFSFGRAQHCLVSFPQFSGGICVIFAGGLLASRTKMATAIKSTRVVGVSRDMSARDMICEERRLQIPGMF